MTKTILVPTDFSTNALYAAEYACRLASMHQYNIHLFHCYTSESISFEQDDAENPLFKADLLMQELKNRLLSSFDLLHISTSCVSGLLTEVLPDMAVKPSYDLIVMGTTGAGKGKSIFWGSNASSITAKATIPVLAIPESNNSFSLDRIALLTNFKPEELETLKEYLQKVSSIPVLEIIHVYSEKEDLTEVQQQLDSWSFIIQDLQGIDEVRTIVAKTDHTDKHADSIPEVVSNTIQQGQYDVILVTKTRKTFFERLFKKSVSQEVVLHLTTPTFFDKS